MILVKKRLGVAVAVDIDISHGIEYCGVLAATLDTSLKPWKNQRQPFLLPHFVDKLVNREVAIECSVVK